MYVFEGIDASGKNSHSKKFVEDLKMRGRKVQLFSFPDYETPLGQAIKQHLTQQWKAFSTNEEGAPQYASKLDPLMFQCMMTVNRFEAVHKIYKALMEDHDVVLDRYWPSGFAYGAADGIDAKWLRQIHDLLPEPDFVVLMDIPPAESVRRRPERRDRYEKQPGLLERVRENYLALFKMESQLGGIEVNTKWTVVNAMGEFDDVHSRVLDAFLLTKLA